MGEGFGIARGGGSGGGSTSLGNIIAAGSQTANSIATVLFSDSNGISFGMSNSSIVTASHNGITSQTIQPITISAANGSYNSHELKFVDANGLTFLTGTDGIQATVRTDYQSSGNYLTTAAQSNQVVNSVNGSTGAISLLVGSSLSSSQNGSTITFGLASNITTALQSAGNYLTTARASNDAVGLNSAQSNVTWSVNSSGISFDARGYAGTGTSATNATITLNSNGIAVSVAAVTNSSFSVQDFATTINPVARIAFSTGNNITLSLSTGANSVTVGVQHNLAGTSTGFGGNLISASMTHNSSGLNLSLNHPAWLTTARASNDAIGLNTAQTNVTWTVNSSGISFNAAGYAGIGTSATNASITLNTNGLAISVASPAAGVGIAAGTRTATTAGNLLFDTGNGITFGLNAVGGSVMTASHNGITTGRASNDAIGLNTAQTNVTWTVNSSGLSLNASGYAGTGTTFNGANISGSLTQNSNGIQISLSGPPSVTVSRYNEYKEAVLVAGEIGQASLHIQPWLIPNVQFDRVIINNAMSNATNSSGSFTLSQWFGIYTRNANTLSLVGSTSISTNFTGSGTAGSYSLYGGLRGISLGSTSTLTGGMYWLGLVRRTTSGGVNQTVSQLLVSQINSSFSGLMGVASNATNQLSLGLGVYTVSTVGIPNSIAFTEINGQSSIFLRPPSLYLVSGTV